MKDLLKAMGYAVWVISKKNNYPRHPKSSLGIFTPTEASVIAAVYACLAGVFIYKKLSFKKIQIVVLDSIKTSASLMVLIGFANLFGWILVVEQFPQFISGEILFFTENKYVVLLLMNLVLIVVGTFMETIAALLILFPIC